MDPKKNSTKHMFVCTAIYIYNKKHNITQNALYIGVRGFPARGYFILGRDVVVVGGAGGRE